MKKLHCITILLALFLTNCSKRDICDNLFKKDQKEECIVIPTSRQWGSILVIKSHTYPQDLYDITGIEYNFQVFSDPKTLILFIQNNKVIHKNFGTCPSCVFSDSLNRNGIVIITNDDCLKIKLTDAGQKFVHP